MIPLLVTLILAGSAAPPDSPSGERSLSLEECVRMALDRNADIASAEHAVDAAEASRASMAGNFGPRVRVDGTILRHADEYAIPLAPPPAPPLVVREQVTSTTSLTVIQPITPLLAVYAGFRLRDFGVDAARIHRDAVRRDVAYQATEAYYRLLQAHRLAEVAATSVEQVESQVERARAFHARGVLGRNDVLRAEIALAAAKQRRIQADGSVTLASARLAMVLGLPSGTSVVPSWAPESPAARPVQSAEDTVAQALSGRAEIRELDARIAAARAGRSGAWTRLAPQLNAIGAISRMEGSSFQEEESRYVGLSLTWDVWDWGSSFNAAREANAQVRQAEAARAKARDGIALDARSAHVAFTSAREALHVAEAAVAQAEENYRIETRRYEEAAATTFDVLDAESLLTQARAQYQTALYDSHIAAANLERAMGRIPGAAPSNP